MQAVHDYWRGVPLGGFRFMGVEGMGRSRGLHQFSQKVIWRGNYDLIETLFPWGRVHPNFSNFYAGEISGGVRVPSHGRQAWRAAITFTGVRDASKMPVTESIGWYISGKYFPKLEGGGPSMINVPGKLANVNNIQINQPVKSYARKYVTTTAPSDPVIDANGVMSQPANFVPPTTPVALSWLTDANATYNFPNGWYLANSNFDQERLSGGVVVPIWHVSEQWLYAPPKSTL